MSDSLVNTSLKLVGYKQEFKPEKKKQKRDKYKGILSLIPLKHRLVPKQDKIDVSSILVHSDHPSIDKIRSQKQSKTDIIEQNVQRLLMLSGNKINDRTCEKILNRVQSKKRVPKKKEKPVPKETTVFTEEDFKKFEKEYFE